MVAVSYFAGQHPQRCYFLHAHHPYRKPDRPRRLDSYGPCILHSWVFGRRKSPAVVEGPCHRSSAAAHTGPAGTLGRVEGPYRRRSSVVAHTGPAGNLGQRHTAGHDRHNNRCSPGDLAGDVGVGAAHHALLLFSYESSSSTALTLR